MIFLHASRIRSHGFLSDTTCRIDSRFVLKITGYGFPSLRLEKDLEQVYAEQEGRNYYSLLWRAPELLRHRMPPCGTQKGKDQAFPTTLSRDFLIWLQTSQSMLTAFFIVGDVYSFAIIARQIALLSEPYPSHTQDTQGFPEEAKEQEKDRYREIVMEVETVNLRS